MDSLKLQLEKARFEISYNKHCASKEKFEKSYKLFNVISGILKKLPTTCASQ